jgi:hypothetical protein
MTLSGSLEGWFSLKTDGWEEMGRIACRAGGENKDWRA